MKIKTKLTLGVGLLFLLIIVLAVLGALQVNSLATDAKNILEANYNTMEYSRNMLKALDELPADKEAFDVFEKNLKKQEKNVTEPGEGELTESLSARLNELKQKPDDVLIPKKIRDDLNDIMKLNLNAIQRKSAVAERTAHTATLWISITGTLCFLIAFILLVNLPGNIGNPIKVLTESIKQIAAMNYSQRVNFQDHGEFGELASSFNTMAEKLEEYNSSNLAQLMMEKKRIESLINNMNDPVIGLDENKKVLFANEEALKITGLKAETLVGRFILDVAVTNDLIRSLIKELTDVGNSLERKKIQPMKIFSDGKESYFEKQILDISIIPSGEREKKLIGYVIFLKNVTSYKELDFARTNFIATVSHEFKTPISSIKMSLQLLQNEKVGVMNEEQNVLVESIKEDAGRLLKITDELLNLTQVDSSNIQLSILPADPAEIFSYAVNANKVSAEQKHIQLLLECPDNICKVIADSEKTAWVLTNLISNAIRYSHEHSEIRLKVEQREKKIAFAVKDSGQGIAPEYRAKIFDRYFRVPGTQKEGTGLGLAISKEFIEAQGGSIGVESEYGAGSTFTILLNAV